jgi:hypothetical protein
MNRAVGNSQSTRAATTAKAHLVNSNANNTRAVRNRERAIDIDLRKQGEVGEA